MSILVETSKIKRFEKWLRLISKGVIKSSSEEMEALSEEIRQYLQLAQSKNEILRKCFDFTEKNNSLNDQRMKADQDILLIGQIGQAGTYLLGKYYFDELRERLSARFIKEYQNFYETAQKYPSVDDFLHADISAVYVVGEGGLSRTLYQLGKDFGKGYRVFGRDVPTSQITIEFCEFFDLDPWQLLSCGCILVVTSNGMQLMRKITEQMEVPCAIIGYTTADKDKMVIYSETPSRVNRPEPDALLQTIWKYWES